MEGIISDHLPEARTAPNVAHLISRSVQNVLGRFLSGFGSFGGASSRGSQESPPRRSTHPQRSRNTTQQPLNRRSTEPQTPASQATTLLGHRVLEPLHEPQTFPSVPELDLSALMNFDQHTYVINEPNDLGPMVGQADFSMDATELTSAETSQVTSAQSPLYDSTFQLLDQNSPENPNSGAGGQESNNPTVDSRSVDSSPDTAIGSPTFPEDSNHRADPNTALSQERSLANQEELLFGVGAQAQEQDNVGALCRHGLKTTQSHQVSAENTGFSGAGIHGPSTA